MFPKTTKTEADMTSALFSSELNRQREELAALRNEREQWTTAATKIQAKNEALESRVRDLERILAETKTQAAAELKRAVDMKISSTIEASVPGDRFEVIGAGRVSGGWSVSRFTIKGSHVTRAEELGRFEDLIAVPGNLRYHFQRFGADLLSSALEDGFAP